MGDWIDRICQIDGDAKLSRYREDAVRLAEVVGASPDRVASLSRMIGAALGTQEIKTGSKALTARQARLPYDQGRPRLFGTLIDALRESAPQNRPVPDKAADRYQHLPFFEAYFSNFIEGTEFELDDAVDVVYAGKQIAGRANDSHDLTGTYRVVGDLEDMSTTATSSGEFLQLLRSRHATILPGRPEKNLGHFKETPNEPG